MKIDLVVTRNPSFLAYLVDAKIVVPAVPCFEYVTASDVIGKHVVGDMLPYTLAGVTESYTIVPLDLPRELIDKRLVVADYVKYAREPVKYAINIWRD